MTNQEMQEQLQSEWKTGEQGEAHYIDLRCAIQPSGACEISSPSDPSKSFQFDSYEDAQEAIGSLLQQGQQTTS